MRICSLILVAASAFAAAPSPVADAAMRGDKTAVKTLLDQKADVNSPQADGATALQWAVYKNDLDLADQLLFAEGVGRVSELVLRHGFQAQPRPHRDRFLANRQ